MNTLLSVATSKKLPAYDNMVMLSADEVKRGFAVASSFRRHASIFGLLPPVGASNLLLAKKKRRRSGAFLV